MKNKTIGLIALACSPFLAIDLSLHGGFDKYNPTSIGGLFNFIYMTGWLLSILALRQMHANAKKAVKTVFILQVIFLTLAEISNIWIIVEPGSGNSLYLVLDLFWPISNGFMLITGLTILISRQIKGWQRFIPLFAGLWLPVSIALWTSLGKTPVTVACVGIYSAIAWSVLALAVYTSLPSAKKEDPALSLQA